jgi:hypothetical protein
MHKSKYPPRSRMAERRAFVRKHGLPDDIAHGAAGYRNWGCKCDTCRIAFADEQKDQREYRYQRTEDNGGIAPTELHNASTYGNWGCRCIDCVTDYSANRVQNINMERAS